MSSDLSNVMNERQLSVDIAMSPLQMLCMKGSDEGLMRRYRKITTEQPFRMKVSHAGPLVQ